MSDPLNFRKALADKNEDGKLWTPLDALEDVAGDVREGRVKPKFLCIIWSEQDENGKNVVKSCQAGMSTWELIALLETQKHSIIKGWQR